MHPPSPGEESDEASPCSGGLLVPHPKTKTIDRRARERMPLASQAACLSWNSAFLGVS
jgi:hypothetical protein